MRCSLCNGTIFVGEFGWECDDCGYTPSEEDIHEYFQEMKKWFPKWSEDETH